MKASQYVYGRHIRDTNAESCWNVATCHTTGDAALIAALLNDHAEATDGPVRYGTTTSKLAPYKYEGGGVLINRKYSGFIGRL